jgi:hypothetical protein
MLLSFIPLAAIKGRGAASSIAHRFAVDTRKTFDDSWLASQSHEEGAASPIATQVRYEVAKSALSRLICISPKG